MIANPFQLKFGSPLLSYSKDRELIMLRMLSMMYDPSHLSSEQLHFQMVPLSMILVRH